MNTPNRIEGAIAPSARESIAMHVHDDLRKGDIHAKD
uniref:Uncharacterized protein n=1 Tax=Coprothermobacter proteolyticus (strain ATCC 35245 / DSM 5265 / OCM 4 / BT) TaxID=309798 RepID=B5Y601_COPPD